MINRVLNEGLKKIAEKYLSLLYVFFGYHAIIAFFFKENSSGIIHAILTFYFFFERKRISEKKEIILFNYIIVILTNFYFTSYYSSPLLYLYYFPVLLSTPFLFHIGKNLKQIVFICLLVLVCILINHFTNYSLFSTEVSNFRVKTVNALVIIETFIFVLITLYFMHKKNLQFNEQYRAFSRFDKSNNIINEEAISLQEVKEILPTSSEKVLVEFEKRMILLGKNKNEKINIHFDDFLCIESFGHYIKLFLRSETEVNKTIILRNSIQNISEQLKSYENICQCHRSYIVNIDFIDCLIGNSRKASLKIKHCNIEIPVSRENYISLKTMIKK